MLSKQHRLDRKNLELFFRGKTSFYNGKNIILRIGRTKNKKVRWAFIVSSSIKKNAVARNKVRRRMNEIARELHNSINNEFDLVFLIKLNTKQSISFKTIKNDIIQILKSCGVL